jgi:hypothetical protein
MPDPLSWNTGFGMKVTVFLVGHLDERRVPHVDLGLAGRAHLMVLALDLHPQLLELKRHLAAQVLEGIGRSNREVPLLVARLVAEVGVLHPTAVPPALLGVDVVVAGVLVGLEADVVEDEELRLRTEVGRVGDSRELEVVDRLLRDEAGIARVRLPGDRIDDVADQRQGRVVTERVDDRRLRVGNDQHVACVNRLPAPDTRAVEPEPLLEGFLGELVHRERDMLPLARPVDELAVDQLDALAGRKLQDLFCRSPLVHGGFRLPEKPRTRSPRRIQFEIVPSDSVVAALARANTNGVDHG